ncbi:hypothetical protein SNEBB_005750, partial [Seison nebaliae]
MGGFNIPLVRVECLLRRVGIQQRCKESEDGRVKDLSKEINKRKKVKAFGKDIRNREDFHIALRDEMKNHVDTRGLFEEKESEIKNFQSYLMKDGGGVENIGVAQIRAGTIWSKAMTNRWKSDENKMREEEMKCDKCGNGRETTYHIIQSCPASHGARTERHDKVLDKICSSYIRRDVKFFKEPRIKTKKGLRIPDLIIKDKDVAVVADLQICGEGLMKNGERIKIKKYDDDEVKKFAMKELHCKTAKIATITGNWRGNYMETGLKNCKLNGKEIKIIMARETVKGTARIVAQWRKTSGNTRKRPSRTGRVKDSSASALSEPKKA